MIARHNEFAVNFIGNDLHVMLEADVVHSFQFLFLPYSTGWVVRVAENEGSGLLVSTLALEILEIYLVSAVSYSSQFVFYHLATTVFDA